MDLYFTLNLDCSCSIRNITQHTKVLINLLKILSRKWWWWRWSNVNVLRSFGDKMIAFKWNLQKLIRIYIYTEKTCSMVLCFTLKLDFCWSIRNINQCIKKYIHLLKLIMLKLFNLIRYKVQCIICACAIQNIF